MFVGLNICIERVDHKLVNLCMRCVWLKINRKLQSLLKGYYLNCEKNLFGVLLQVTSTQVYGENSPEVASEGLASGLLSFSQVCTVSGPDLTT